MGLYYSHREIILERAKNNVCKNCYAASFSRNTASIVTTLGKITQNFQFYVVLEVQVYSAAMVIKNLMLKGYFKV